ncbi:MAG: hypothetical protein WDZ82_00155 [Candidatus Paceibacterota bacterium]
MAPVTNVIGDVIDRITSFPTDIIVIAVMIIVLFIGALYVGQRKFTTAIIALYPAIVAYSFLPPSLVNMVTDTDPSWISYSSQLGIFAALSILSFIVIKKYIKKRSIESGKRDTVFSFLQALAASATILAIVVVLVPIAPVYQLSSLVTDLITETTIVAWMIAPLAVLYLFSRD